MFVGGLQAMMATADLHAPAEAATRILPAVAPLTIDSVAEVRRTALQALADFSKVLLDHSKMLDEQATAAGDIFCLAVWCCTPPRQMSSAGMAVYAAFRHVVWCFCSQERGGKIRSCRSQWLSIDPELEPLGS